MLLGVPVSSAEAASAQQTRICLCLLSFPLRTYLRALRQASCTLVTARLMAGCFWVQMWMLQPGHSIVFFSGCCLPVVVCQGSHARHSTQKLQGCLEPGHFIFFPCYGCCLPRQSCRALHKQAAAAGMPRGWRRWLQSYLTPQSSRPALTAATTCRSCWVPLQTELRRTSSSTPSSLPSGCSGC